MVLEKKHRLDRRAYVGSVRATFTFCVKDKRILFDNQDIVNQFLKILEEAINTQQLRNWVYIFMPDHFHAVIEGKTFKSDLWKAMVLFKQKTGYLLSKNNINREWQKDFFDHIHREEEDLVKHIRYILENPVRKGLVKNWEDYPFKGSLDFNLEKLIE
jgi:REP element-mobilizing transposase RayT